MTRVCYNISMKKNLTKNFLYTLYNFAYRFVQSLSIFLLSVLFVSAFIFTCYAEDMTSQEVLRRVDNPLWNFCGMILFLSLAVLIIRFILHHAEKLQKFLFAGVMIWYLIAGVILVLFSKTVPAADALSVYQMAESAASGNYGVIHPYESYLSYYPQQAGLMLYYELIIRIWNLLPLSLPAYHIIKCINVLWVCVIVLFQYKTVNLLFRNAKAGCFYLLLAAGFAPLLFYSSFVYGEVPSFALLSMGIYWFLKYCEAKNHTSAYFRGSLAALTFSIMLRKNSLVFLIAIVIVAFMEWLKTKRKNFLLFAILCTVLGCSVLPFVKTTYELRAGNTLNSGVPAMSYIAMGMQPSSRANGWYNGFNFNTYQQTGMDTQKTVELSAQAISERLDFFKSHPDYALSFYGNKFLSQWSDGTYACRQATLATYGGRREIFKQIYEGSLAPFLIEYCSLYQNLLYLGALLFCILSWKKKQTADTSLSGVSCLSGLPVYIGLIAVIGGFLFHMFWEANSRYIFSYALALLPYCAGGAVMAWEKLTARLQRKSISTL